MSVRNAQFNKGNYNEWDNLVTTQLPLVDVTLREEILPKLDSVLSSMLGGYSEWSREELNARPYVDDSSFKGVYIEVAYFVEDFKVQNVPDEAVEEDEKALSDYMSGGNIEITSTEIDTNTGILKITALYHFDALKENTEEMNNDKV